MKVLLIHDKDLRLPSDAWDPSSNEAGSGGISIHLAHVTAALRQRGWSPSMIRLCHDPHAHACGVASYYELRSSGLLSRPGAYRKLRRILRAESPDIIHLHSAYYSISPSMISRLGKIAPVIHTIHDVTPICFRHTKLHPDGSLCTSPIGLGCVARRCYRLGNQTGFIRDVIRVTLNPLRLTTHRRLPAITVPSLFLKEQLVANGFSADRVRVIRGFSRFGEQGDSASQPTDTNRVLFVGRLTKEKGILEFVRALALLQTDRWDATVVGDGELLDVATREVAARGLSKRVTFSGTASAVVLKHHYETCSLLVLPSLIPESFGMVGVEAMSFAKPAVAYASGGVTEWLEDEVNGLLVERGNVERLANAIDRLLRDEPLRLRLGRAGSSAVRARFGVEQHVDKLLGLYEEMKREFATHAQ